MVYESLTFYTSYTNNKTNHKCHNLYKKSQFQLILTNERL